jgi:peptide/bleomycin uptake transporter
MFREFFFEGGCCRILWAWIGLLAFLAHQAFKAYLAWAINSWYENFYNLLQGQADYSSGSGSGGDRNALARQQVYQSLLDFASIVAPAVFVNPVAGLLRNWWVFSWRRVLMKNYLNRWNTSIPAIEGAAQRVHEDTQRFATGIQNCVSVVLQSIFTLVVFCPVLYDLDPQLMAIAISAAVGGLAVSMLVGWPLVSLEVNNQVVEADLRKRLVLLEADPASTASAASAANNADDSLYSSFVAVFRLLTRNYRRLYLSFFALSTWLSLYEQVAVILPYLLVAPRLFAENPEDQLTLGQLVKVSNSFGKVFDSLNVVSDRWLAITEFRSCLRRLREFEREINSRSPATPARLVPAAMELSDTVSSTAAPWVHRANHV